MAKDVLNLAWREMKRRHFSQAIKLLEGREEIYEDNAEYYIMLGTACLYVGDIGTATSCYTRARGIKLTDTNLLLGQAAIFLRRGNTERAIHYYLEILENEPGNKIAKEAMEFIRVHGDYETICRWVDTGRIRQFYPPIGINPDRIFYFSVGAIAFVFGAIVTFSVLGKSVKIYNGPRRDLSSIALSGDEKSEAQEKDLAGQSYKYLLSNKEITKSYEKALDYFQKNDDNHAQIEINRLLNSNATLSIKQKARVLMGYLSVPTFDTLLFSPSYAEVEDDPYLYLDCYVIWSGRISDVEQGEKYYKCNFLVGYDSMKKLEGIVVLSFDSVPTIENDKPLKILAQISSENGKLVLKGKAVYQSVNF